MMKSRDGINSSKVYCKYYGNIMLNMLEKVLIVAKCIVNVSVKIFVLFCN